MTRSFSRRTFLGASAAAGVLASYGFAKELAPKRLGIQLYTVRNIIGGGKQDDVLKSIAEIGYKEIEGADYHSFVGMAATAKSLGLTQPSCHIPTTAVLGGGDGPELDKVFADLKGIGTEFAVVPYIAPNLRTAEYLEPFGDKMNKAGEKAKSMGLQLAYHNHAFEWGQMNGKRIFDIMFGNTDPKLVKLEVDVFWISVGGLKPVEFLNSYKERVALVHLKDKAAGLKPQFNENVPAETFKELGNGSLDFKSILETAEKIGVKHYFVEQDQTVGSDPLASVRQSFKYISGLRS